MKNVKEMDADQAAARGLGGLAAASIDTVRTVLGEVHDATRQGQLEEARRQIDAGLGVLRELDETARRAGVPIDRELADERA